MDARNRKRKPTSDLGTVAAKVTSRSKADDPESVVSRPCTLRSGRILTPHVPQHNATLFKRVFTNPVVMREVFRNLGGVDCLKNFRLVCRDWDNIARPGLLSKTIFDVMHDYYSDDDKGDDEDDNDHDDKDDYDDDDKDDYDDDKDDDDNDDGDKQKWSLGWTGQPPYPNVLIGHSEQCVPKTPFTKPDDFAPALNCFKEGVEYLQMGSVLHWDHPIPSFSFDSLLELCLPKLRTLVLIDVFMEPDWNDSDQEETDYGQKETDTDFLVELIQRSPNLQELDVRQEFKGADFFRTLFASLKLNPTFVSNLQILRIQIDKMQNRDIETLRGMTLRLKTLAVTFIVFEADPFSATAGWIQDMRLTLTNLELDLTWDLESNLHAVQILLFKLSFLSEMPALKVLKVGSAQHFGVKGIPEFLSKLPVLKTLRIDWAAPNTTGELETFLQPLEVFPSIKDFTLAAESPASAPRFRKTRIVPKLFPNLKIFQLYIFSWKEWFGMIDDLKDLLIEDLVVLLSREVLHRKMPTRRPSLSQWKALRNLTILVYPVKTPHGPMLYPPPIPFLSILSEAKTLTSLELTGFTGTRLAGITELVVELPRLRYLVFGDMPSKRIYDYDDRVILTEGEVLEKFQTALAKKGLPPRPCLGVIIKKSYNIR